MPYSRYMAISLSLSQTHYSWKFNTSLPDNYFRTYLTNTLQDCLYPNNNAQVPHLVIWEAFKALTRGHNISYQSAHKKACLKKFSEIESQLPALEEAYRRSGSQNALNSLLKLKYENNHYLSKQVVILMLKLNWAYFEIGDTANNIIGKANKRPAG